MIIRVLARKTNSFEQLLSYMFKDQEQPYIITHNMKGTDIEAWVEEFQHNEDKRQRRRKNSTILTHEILSWHGSDQPTFAMIEDMTRHYISNRNPHGMYVGVIHTDRDHTHVHLCVSGVEYQSGQSMRMSRSAFRKLKVSVEDYQRKQYPELTHSQVDFTQPKHNRYKTYWIKKRGKVPTKDIIRNTIKKCLEESATLAEFVAELKEYGIEPYYRKGEMTGVWVGKRKYRLNRIGIELDFSIQKRVNM